MESGEEGDAQKNKMGKTLTLNTVQSVWAFLSSYINLQWRCEMKTLAVGCALY